MPSSTVDPRTAAQHLVRRVVGDRLVDRFVIELEAGLGDQWFSVAASEGRVTLRAGSPVAIAVALRHYLTHACHIDLSWDRSIPVRDLHALPDWDSGRVETPFELRYHLNYCTFGYTTAYWTWEDWEREIDWMALHGVTLPLNIVGYEAIWLRVLQRRGLTEEVALAYLGSPAYLPWLWMGCIHDLGTPMTREWAERHLELGRRIVERERDLGMRVVVPAFAGYLPDQLASADAPSVEWFGFENTQLEPTDPLFREIGLELLVEVEREFGSDHFYALDPFIEGRPPYAVPDGVGAVASALHDLLDEHDPESVWVLQAWPFGYAREYWTDEHIASFLSAVPRGRMLVLDLWAEHLGHAERTNGFHGHDWAWCMLNNFGGRTGSHGAWESVAAVGAVDARGTGFTMEALDRNAIMFELMTDSQWSDDPVTTNDLAAARYESSDPRLVEGFAEWVRLCFARDEVRHAWRSVVIARPSLRDGRWPTSGTMQGPYPDRAIVEALERALGNYLAVAGELGSDASPGLMRDVVDLGLETLSGHAVLEFESLMLALDAGETVAFAAQAERFLAIIAAMDQLAGTHPRFLFGGWITAASGWATDESDAQALRADAKRLFTSWAHPGHPLNDYAGRHWSGLLDGYYGARWRLWLDRVSRFPEDDGIQQNQPSDADGFETVLREWEQSWLDQDEPFSAIPAGDPVVVLREALDAIARRPEHEEKIDDERTGKAPGGP